MKKFCAVILHLRAVSTTCAVISTLSACATQSAHTVSGVSSRQLANLQQNKIAKYKPSEEIQQMLAHWSDPAESVAPTESVQAKPIENFKTSSVKIASTEEAPLMFDLPITYNAQVRDWIYYFQNEGHNWFHTSLERSYKFVPYIQSILKQYDLPLDLSYIALIESGLSTHAVSHAAAVGPWQFIEDTAHRFGLMSNEWLDERRDLGKSTHAAAQYLRFLYGKFGSWYLALASYNTGENRISKMVQRHNSKNFWQLSRNGAFVQETQNYVPKIIAAMLIAKAPALYGFRDLEKSDYVSSELFYAPGGTELEDLARHLGVTKQALRELNPELTYGAVPNYVAGHFIRIPRGASHLASQYFQNGLASAR